MENIISIVFAVAGNKNNSYKILINYFGEGPSNCIGENNGLTASWIEGGGRYQSKTTCNVFVGFSLNRLVSNKKPGF
jgi:hypothetical protein